MFCGLPIALGTIGTLTAQVSRHVAVMPTLSVMARRPLRLHTSAPIVRRIRWCLRRQVARGSRVHAISPSMAVSIAAAVAICHGSDGPFVSQHTLALALVEVKGSCLAPLFIRISATTTTATLLVLLPLALLVVLLVLVLLKILMASPADGFIAWSRCARLLRLGGGRNDFCSRRVLHARWYGLALGSRRRPPRYARPSTPSRFQGLELASNVVRRDVNVNIAPIVVAWLASSLLMVLMLSHLLLPTLLLLHTLLFLADARRPILGVLLAALATTSIGSPRSSTTTTSPTTTAHAYWLGPAFVARMF
jgi:hypothetical protein